MKFTLGTCRLEHCLNEAGMSIGELADLLFLKQALLLDYTTNTRIMPLRIALNIADMLGCPVQSLYELIPNAGFFQKSASGQINLL
jgi:hypothetical protein